MNHQQERRMASLQGHPRAKSQGGSQYKPQEIVNIRINGGLTDSKVEVKNQSRDLDLHKNDKTSSLRIKHQSVDMNSSKIYVNSRKSKVATMTKTMYSIVETLVKAGSK